MKTEPQLRKGEMKLLGEEEEKEKEEEEEETHKEFASISDIIDPVGQLGR